MWSCRQVGRRHAGAQIWFKVGQVGSAAGGQIKYKISSCHEVSFLLKASFRCPDLEQEEQAGAWLWSKPGSVQMDSKSGCGQARIRKIRKTFRKYRTQIAGTAADRTSHVQLS